MSGRTFGDTPADSSKSGSSLTRLRTVYLSAASKKINDSDGDKCVNCIWIVNKKETKEKTNETEIENGVEGCG